MALPSLFLLQIVHLSSKDSNTPEILLYTATKKNPPPPPKKNPLPKKKKKKNFRKDKAEAIKSSQH